MGRKWQKQPGGATTEVLVPNLRVTALFAFAFNGDTIRQLPSYEKLKVALDEDSQFSKYRKLAGSWGESDNVIFFLLSLSMVESDGHLKLMHERFFDGIHALWRQVDEPTATYQVSRRVLGVRLWLPAPIEFDNGLKLVNLTDDQAFERQPFQGEELFGSGVWLTDHYAEFQTELAVEIQDSLADAEGQARVMADKQFSDGLDALLLAKEGQIGFGPGTLRSILGPSISGMGLPENIYDQVYLITAGMNIIPADMERILKAHQIITQHAVEDGVLRRAIRRLLLGARRRDRVDQIVDYMIAWESILLTAKGQANPQELSYRFSLNGSSILNAIDPKYSKHDAYKKMESAYNVRSGIVHGLTDKEIATRLKKGGFDFPEQLSEFLGNELRNTIFWLVEKEHTERPYIKAGGWEDMLWL